MEPIIGIPQCLDSGGRIQPGREYLYGDIAYVRAIERAGGIALLLPIQSRARELVERIDGLLLPGGDDFLPPSPYPPEVCFDAADSRQVDFDRTLLAAALERGLPILGICYGAQLMALQRGGRLQHDIPHDVPGALDHQLPEREGRHEIRIEPGSRLAGILGAETASVNSLHHQAIEDPGAGLRVSATASDGVIEAIESVDSNVGTPAEGGPASRGLFLGVQWHPEKQSGADSDALFAALIDAARSTTSAASARNSGDERRGDAAGSREEP
jgi:putative glutamine amidotransferase